MAVTKANMLVQPRLVGYPRNSRFGVNNSALVWMRLRQRPVAVRGSQIRTFSLDGAPAKHSKQLNNLSFRILPIPIFMYL
jgi:hypothetical protein